MVWHTLAIASRAARSFVRLAAWATIVVFGGMMAAEASPLYPANPGAASPATMDAGSAKDELEAAIKKFQSRDLAGARASLDAALKKNPELPPSETLMAQFFLATNQTPAARTELEASVRKHPQDPEAYLILADLGWSEGWWAEGQLLYERALTLAEKMPDAAKRKVALTVRARAGLATVLESTEQWDQAREQLAAWLKVEPDNALALQRWAQTLFHVNQAKEAYKALERANKLDPKLAPAAVAMAGFYTRAGDKANAEKFLNIALKQSPDDFATQMAAARLFLQAEQVKEAQTHADEALRLEPDNLDAKLIRGMIARWAEDLKTARAQLESAHLQSPTNPTVNNQLALTLIEMPDEHSHRTAWELAEMTARQHPNNSEAAATLFWINHRLGRQAEAARGLTAVTSGGTLSPESSYFVGVFLKDQGRTAEARTLLEKAVATEQPFSYRSAARKLLAELDKSPDATAPQGAKPGNK